MLVIGKEDRLLDSRATEGRGCCAIDQFASKDLRKPGFSILQVLGIVLADDTTSHVA
jgi:hypothetical protein